MEEPQQLMGLQLEVRSSNRNGGLQLVATVGSPARSRPDDPEAVPPSHPACPSDGVLYFSRSLTGIFFMRLHLPFLKFSVAGLAGSAAVCL